MKMPYDIHWDITATFNFIDAHLPEKYSREVWTILPENRKHVSLDYIRKVKTGRIKNAVIINALYRVAQFHRLQQQK